MIKDSSRLSVYNFIGQNPTDLVILLHGYGSDGKNMLDLSHYLGDCFERPYFISPNAIENFEFGPPGYQWYSLMDRSRDSLLKGSVRAMNALRDFINTKTRDLNLTTKNVTLVGFSQGCMVSLFTALRLEFEVKCVVGLSGTLVAPDLIQTEARSKFPICLIHGDQDVVVPISLSKVSHKYLIDAGYEVTFNKIQGLEHTIDERCIKIAKNFLSSLQKH